MHLQNEDSSHGDMSDSDGDSADDDTEAAWKEVLPNDDLDVVVFTQKLFKKRFPVETRLDDDTFFAIYLTEQQSRADLIRLAPHAHTREGRFNADYVRKLSRYCQRQRPVVEETPSRASGQGYLPAVPAYSVSSDDLVTSDEPHQRSPVLGDDLFAPPTSSLPGKCNSTSRKRRHSTVRSVFLQMRTYSSLTLRRKSSPASVLITEATMPRQKDRGYLLCRYPFRYTVFNTTDESQPRGVGERSPSPFRRHLKPMAAKHSFEAAGASAFLQPGNGGRTIQISGI